MLTSTLPARVTRATTPAERIILSAMLVPLPARREPHLVTAARAVSNGRSKPTVASPVTVEVGGLQ
jgi:hypothetical protein